MFRTIARVSTPFALLTINACSGEIQSPKENDSERDSAPLQAQDAAAPTAKPVAATDTADGGTAKGGAPPASDTPAPEPACVTRCNASLGRVCGANNPCDSVCTKASAQSLACLEQLTTCDKLRMIECLGGTPTPSGPAGK